MSDITTLDGYIGSAKQVIAYTKTASRTTVAGGDTHGMDKTGLPYVAANSCIAIAAAPDSTSTGIPDILFEIANA
jgi:hypothetical protein